MFLRLQTSRGLAYPSFTTHLPLVRSFFFLDSFGSQLVPEASSVAPSPFAFPSCDQPTIIFKAFVFFHRHVLLTKKKKSLRVSRTTFGLWSHTKALHMFSAIISGKKGSVIFSNGPCHCRRPSAIPSHRPTPRPTSTPKAENAVNLSHNVSALHPPRHVFASVCFSSLHHVS